MRKRFLIQPYWVGSKKSKSIAVIIPAAIVKEYDIDPSMGFLLKYDKYGISLEYLLKDKNTMSVNSSFEAKNQQTSIVTESK